jgi:hypothetical protein
MGKLLMLALFLSAPLALCQTATMSARDYYNELHKTGGLDIAGDCVCFYKDESNPNFFIFILSKDIRERMKAGGSLSKLTNAQHDAMKKDSLIERGYAKGIPFPDRHIMSKDGDSWVRDDRKPGEDGNLLREKLTVDWQTLRFKQSIKTYRADSTLIGEVRSFGKCEVILPSYN